MLSRKVTLDEFSFEKLTAPPIYSRFTPTDIGDLYTLANSVKYSSKLAFKYKSIDEIMKRRGCEKFVSGTNRITYRPYESNQYLFKIAFDSIGLGDNPAEFRNQQFLKPFVTKLFEVDTTGVLACVERVNAITNREEFFSVAPDIYQAINAWFVGEYVLADFGSKFFMNWGVRDNFGPVLLDFPYVYKLDGNKLFCRAKNPYSPTGCCEGEIDYDDGFNNLICTKCGTIYKAKELEKKEHEGMLFVRDAKGGLKMKGRVTGGTKKLNNKVATFDGFVQQEPVRTIPAGAVVKEAEKKEEPVVEEKKEETPVEKIETSDNMTVNGAVYSKEEEEQAEAKKMLQDIVEAKRDAEESEDIINKEDLIPGGTGREGGINVISFKKEEKKDKPFIDQIPEFFDRIREFMKDDDFITDEQRELVWDLIEKLYEDTTKANRPEKEEDEELIPGGTGREGGINVISFKKPEEDQNEDATVMFDKVAAIIEDLPADEYTRVMTDDSILTFIDNNFKAKVEVENYEINDGIVSAVLSISVYPDCNTDPITMKKQVVFEDQITIVLNELKEAKEEGAKYSGTIDDNDYSFNSIGILEAEIMNVKDFVPDEQSKKIIAFVDPDNHRYITVNNELIVTSSLNGYQLDKVSIVATDYLKSLIDLEKKYTFEEDTVEKDSDSDDEGSVEIVEDKKEE